MGQGITRQHIPPHPGGHVRESVIEAFGLSVTQAARSLGVTRAALSAVLNERADLSPEMALRLEKAFGLSMEELMLMQSSLDIARVREREAEIKVEPFDDTSQSAHKTGV
ncbi:transcriptional regulator [Rhizobium dioscoreae]|uniref:HigA family addiction module antitoxin n=1 Tax=Rhizobium dioscoreae TaxID=2653122 RepID=UPI0012612601|nr:HigA family addiction module antitoxin [Rhizobium dioscoreae]GES43984.1 transcriptional regulator [Rhizobium dioscoreae]